MNRDRLRPDPVRMRIVRPPHERLDAHVVDQLGPDLIELEGPGAAALPAPVVARLHLEPRSRKRSPPTRSPSGRARRNPADAALAERDPHVRYATPRARRRAITAARMLTRFIWKPAVLVKNAARRVSPVCFSRTPGGSDGKVPKVQRQVHIVDRAPARAAPTSDATWAPCPPSTTARGRAAPSGRRDRSPSPPRRASAFPGPSSATKLRTVEPDVNVTASTSCAASAAAASASPGPVTVRYAGTTSTIGAALAQRVGQRLARLERPRQQHAAALAHAARAQPVEQALGAVLGGHEVGDDAVRRPASPPSRRPRPPPSRPTGPGRRAGRRQPREEALDRVGRGEQHPVVHRQVARWRASSGARSSGSTMAIVGKHSTRGAARLERATRGRRPARASG